MIRGKTISNIDFFEMENEGKKEWFANIYYNNSKSPIRVPKSEAMDYMKAMASANDIDPDDKTAVAQLAEKGLFHTISEKEADYRFVTNFYEKKNKKVHHKLSKKKVVGTLAIFTTVALLATCFVSCQRKKSSNKNAEGLSNSQYYSSTFEELLAKLQAGPKKDAVKAVQSTLKNFNDNLALSIMREGEDKHLAHSWEENIASYLAFNEFTDEELFQIFDTYKIDSKDLYEQLKLANMKEMLYYARATSTSGRADLLKSEEGKQFFHKYENKLLEFNNAETKEEKQTIAKEFYAMARTDFPIEEEDKVGFIHTNKGYEDYAYAVTPIISAMEVMTKNINVSLNNTEIKFFNELGMCNFAEEKLETYQTQLASRQSIAIAKEELRSEYKASTDEKGDVNVTEVVSYEQLKDAGIASVAHYDLSAETNDVGTIKGYWDDVTLLIVPRKANGTSSTSTTSYRKSLTEEELKKESPAVQQQAQQQKEKINNSYASQNATAKEESDKKKVEIESKIEEEKKALEEEIKNDNAWLNDNKNNSSNTSSSSSSSSTSEVPGRPSIDDVDDHIKIDDDYVDENGNLEFDGPIYDKDGNIIDNPSAKVKANTTTYSGASYVQRDSGLYIPSSMEEVNSYVDSLADQTSTVNQNTNPGIKK